MLSCLGGFKCLYMCKIHICFEFLRNLYCIDLHPGSCSANNILCAEWLSRKNGVFYSKNLLARSEVLFSDVTQFKDIKKQTTNHNSKIPRLLLCYLKSRIFDKINLLVCYFGTSLSIDNIFMSEIISKVFKPLPWFTRCHVVRDRKINLTLSPVFFWGSLNKQTRI